MRTLQRYSSIFVPALSLFAVLFFCRTAMAGNPPVLGAELQSQLKNKYPAQSVAKWCGGKVIGHASGAAVVLQDASKSTFLVVWVTPGQEIQELDSVKPDSPDDFPLECMDAKEARETESTLKHSEAIVNFLKVPAGSGAVCYFTDENTAKCWSPDHATGKLRNIGGWQT